MRATAMCPTIPNVSQVNEGQEREPELSERDRAAAWFREAVGTYEVQKEAASDIEVDPAYLKHQCSGLKPVNLVHLERMRRKRPKAFARMVQEMGRDADLVVIAQPEVRLTGEERALLFATREALGAMWPAYRDRVAARVYRCRGELIEAALEYEAARK